MAIQALTTATAAASRFLVSQSFQVPAPVGIVYNVVDMAVSSIAFKILNRHGDTVPALFASRVVGILIAGVVTTLAIGPMDLAVATALNLTSLAVCLLLALAADPLSHEFVPV